ncbi:hypothetical protein JOF53_002887 [Crossiella equi]|uniref:Uncharacterized protein n=1 Tax=Crossiella equi TaxID=130796 RepID=A0ABS5ABR4_9PSEU|nr:hypothetical protein [Crossiella equi]MBP2474015.1 hypothetical protein [Crossiella equi]
MTNRAWTQADTEAAKRMTEWDPAPVSWGCDCGRPCWHGEICPHCHGRLRHVDRSPDTFDLDPVRWTEWYRCTNERCLVGVHSMDVSYPDRPWGFTDENGRIVVGPGVAHPYHRTGRFPR